MYNRVPIVNTILCNQMFVKTVDFILSSYSATTKTNKQQKQQHQQSIWRWWRCLLPWLWSFRRCLHRYKLIKSYTFNMCSFGISIKPQWKLSKNYIYCIYLQNTWQRMELFPQITPSLFTSHVLTRVENPFSWSQSSLEAQMKYRQEYKVFLSRGQGFREVSRKVTVTPRDQCQGQRPRSHLPLRL